MLLICLQVLIHHSASYLGIFEFCGCKYNSEASLAKDCQGCLRLLIPRGKHATPCLPWNPW